MNKSILLLAIPVLLFSYSARSDEVIIDDLIVNMSMCVGDQCVDGEDFGRDNLRIKTDDPLILFTDTSASASFPSNDWSLGITDNSVPGPAQFFINDETNDVTVLRLDAGSGGIALGAGSSVEDGAISVGATGAERRIVNVADGIDATDAVSVGQFTTFSDNINNNFSAQLATERAEIDADITSLQDRIDALAARVDAIVDELAN